MGKGIRVHFKKVIALYRGNTTTEWTACGKPLFHDDCHVALTEKVELVDCKNCLSAIDRDRCSRCRNFPCVCIEGGTAA